MPFDREIVKLQKPLIPDHKNPGGFREQPGALWYIYDQHRNRKEILPKKAFSGEVLAIMKDVPKAYFYAEWNGLHWRLISQAPGQEF